MGVDISLHIEIRKEEKWHLMTIDSPLLRQDYEYDIFRTQVFNCRYYHFRHFLESKDDFRINIIDPDSKNHWYGSSFDDSDRTYPTYERKTIDIMKRAVYVLRMAYIYAKRVDWMLSGDDGEDTLVERLQEELQALKAKYPSGKFTFKEKDVYFDKECERYMLMDDDT